MRAALADERAAEITRLAAEAARSLGCGDAGLFTGSDAAAAGCKSVIGQRLKQAGMHWSTGGADAIIALRCREASSQWEAICNTPHTQTRPA